MFKSAPKPNSSTKAQISSKVPLLPNPCYGQYGLLIRNYQNENK